MAVRTHDELYLRENRYDDVKESFKFCLKVAREAGFDERGTVCDVGCAAGEYAHYLVSALPRARVVGVDLLAQLVDKARTMVAGAEFRVGSVLEPDTLPEDFADAAFLIGVHSIFDDPRPAFDNLIRWTRPGGVVVVFGLFNRYDVDVFVQSRGANDSPGHRESGWNMISQATVTEWMKENEKVARFRFEQFTLPLDLSPRADDPLRSWTFKDEHGKRLVVNGLGLIHDFHALVVEL